MTASGPRHVLKLAAHLVRIVGQRLDLLARQDRSERQRAVRGDVVRIAPDHDAFRHSLQRQDQHVLVVARAQPLLLELGRRESRKLRPYRVTARHELVDRGLAFVVSLGRIERGGFGGRLHAGNRHRGVRQHGARRIHDREDELRDRLRGLCGRHARHGRDHRDEQKNGAEVPCTHAVHPHFLNGKNAETSYLTI